MIVITTNNSTGLLYYSKELGCYIRTNKNTNKFEEWKNKQLSQNKK